MSKVKVISTVQGSVNVVVPALNFRHEWMAEGASFVIEEDVLEQLLYDNGAKYMFDTGMLYIEDMAVKQRLGLEPEDAKEPVNIIVLDEAARNDYLTKLDVEEFKEKVDKLSREQICGLADYAVEHMLIDFEKTKYLKAKCGKDIIQAIKLGDLDKEE